MDEQKIATKPQTNKHTICVVLVIILAILGVGGSVGAFFLGRSMGFDAGHLAAKDEYYYSRYEEGVTKGRAERGTELLECEWKLEKYQK